MDYEDCPPADNRTIRRRSSKSNFIGYSADRKHS